MANAWNLPRGCRGENWRSDKLRPLAESAIEAVLAEPTAPYHEQLPAAAVRQWCRARKWRVSEDDFGNLVVRVPGKKGGRPSIAFEAHLDHPAMVVTAPLNDEGLIPASFYGGHPGERMPGGKVLLVSPDGKRRGRGRVVVVGEKNPRAGELKLWIEAAPRIANEVSKGWIATWDLPLKLSDKKIRNVVCDDLAGVASILAGLDLAWRSGMERPALAYFTRCEENGFVGCLQGIHLGSFPKDVPVVVLECSPRLPNAQPGDGPICRVGDRLSIYDPSLLQLLEDAGDELKRRVPGFNWQRKLMDGGACEATAFCSAGFSSAGMALALTNYHNVPDDRKRKGPAHEEVDRGDQENLVLWLATLAMGRKAKAPAPGPALRLEKLRKQRANLFPQN